MDFCRKRGRPRKDDARKIPFCIRLNRGEVSRLVFLMEELDMTAPEVFRFAMERCYDDMFRD